MKDIHRLLNRQLKKYFGTNESIPDELRPLLEAVSNSYKHYESDRVLIERTMELSGTELTESNQKLVEETKRHGLLFESLKESIKDVSVDDTEVDYDDLLSVAEILKTEINKRKNAEREISIREEKYRNIIENMNLGMVETNLNGRIINAYDTFCNMLGYSKEEVVGLQNSDLFYDKLNKNLIKFQNLNRVKGSFGVHEVQLKHKNGSKVWMIVSAAPIMNSKGQISGSVEIHFDITNRKKIEADLVHARKIAENSLKSKEQFLANMSHEIRTPMNAIIGMSGLMQSTNLNGEQVDFQKAIQSSAEGLLVIINDILDMSRISAGKFTFEEIDFDLDVLLNHLLKTMSYRAEDKGIYLRLHREPKINKYLKNAPVRLNQILVNLISNAIKFTSKGGVDVYLELIEKQQDNDTIKFSITDTGIGIEETRLIKIFESFTQADASTSRKFGGSGLGLTISKELVHLLGGELGVKSEINKGSVFSFELKIAHGKPIARKETVPNVQKDLSGAAILVVEDNEINRFLAVRLLSQWNANVFEAVNGIEAVNMVKNNPKFNAILMDVQMPEMDGIEATIQIRKSNNNNIPIIALTANAIKGEREKCINSGMDEYLSKPFDPDELYDKISAIIRA